MDDVCECACLKPSSRAVVRDRENDELHEVTTHHTQLVSKFLHQFCVALFLHSMFASALSQGDFPNGSCDLVVVAAHEMKNWRRTTVTPRRTVVRHHSPLFTHGCICNVFGVSRYFANLVVWLSTYGVANCRKCGTQNPPLEVCLTVLMRPLPKIHQAKSVLCRWA